MRYRFAEISIAVITISLAILLIWGIVSLYRHKLVDYVDQEEYFEMAEDVVARHYPYSLVKTEWH